MELNERHAISVAQHWRRIGQRHASIVKRQQWTGSFQNAVLAYYADILAILRPATRELAERELLEGCKEALKASGQNVE